MSIPLYTITLSRCERDDWEPIRLLRNTERRWFGDDKVIDPYGHQRHMKVHGHDFVVATVAEKFAGYGRLNGDDIGVCVCEWARGKGVGKAIVLHLLKKQPNAVARIKAGNAASFALFRNLGVTIETIGTMDDRGGVE